VLAARAFPPQAQIWPVNGHGYAIYVASAGVSWTEARARAEQAGGHLVSIASSGENAFVLGLVNARPDAFVNLIGPWLGGYQPAPTAADEPNNGWQWVDGTPWGVHRLGIRTARQHQRQRKLSRRVSPRRSARVGRRRRHGHRRSDHQLRRRVRMSRHWRRM
jgi:hypothetical protein